MVAGPEIKGWVGDRVVKSIVEGYARVCDGAEVDSVLEDVPSVGPGNVVGNIVDGSQAACIMVLAGRRKHETETDVISCAVTGIGKGLPRVSIAQVVDQVVTDRPGMTDGEAPGMAPDHGDRGVREPLEVSIIVESQMVKNHVGPDKQGLIASGN